MDVEDRGITSNKCTSVPIVPNGYEYAELAGVTLQGNCACVSDVCVWSAVAGFFVDRRHSAKDIYKNAHAVYDESCLSRYAALQLGR